MARIPPEEVRRMARLAALHLSEDEVERLAGEMGEVLGHFAALRQVAEAPEGDRAGPEEGGGADGGPVPEAGELRGPGREVATPLRRDDPDADPLRRPPGQAAPRWADGFFLVPRPPGVAEGS